MTDKPPEGQTWTKWQIAVIVVICLVAAAVGKGLVHLVM